MTVGTLSSTELTHRLEHSGLRIRVGPIIAEIRSSFETVQSCIGLHYAAHDVVTPEEFVDFRVSIQSSRGLRRWIRPKAIFRFEGTPPFQPLPADQSFALLEWGLNWAVAAHCHQYLIVHAAVVERGGRAMLLPAPPGSGKSTLCAALVGRGWRLLSDELALIDVDSGSVVPLPRPISLKNQSIDVIGGFWPEALMSPVVHDTLKGSVAHVQPPAHNVRLSTVCASPGWIVLPRFQLNQGSRLDALSKGAAFMQLVENAFNYSTHGRRGFDALSGFVNASSCFEFHYGGDLDEAVRMFDGIARRT